MSVKVGIRLVGLERWGGDEYTVEVPRVPVAGDVVAGPDDIGEWVVREVVFGYADGFAFEPEVRVTLERKP